MSSGNDPLAILAQEREHILLAEVAGLLHDIGKFCDLHIESNSMGGSGRRWSTDHAYKAVIDNPGSLIYLSRTAANLRKPAVINNVLNAQYPKAADFLTASFKNALQQIAVTVQGTDYLLAELIMMGAPGFAVDRNRSQLLDGKDGWLPALLGVCHQEAHHDKPDRGETQVLANVLVSTAFGYERQLFVVGHPQYSLDIRLGSLPDPPRQASDVPAFKKRIKLEFAYGLGDTRQPVNDVTLADWSFSVASLFKTLVSASLLDNMQHNIRSGWLSWENRETDHDLRWRILRISFDGLAFFERAPTLSDVLGRREALSDALERVRHLLEWHYPLGNEIYRDEYGSAFIVPALDRDDKAGNRLHSMIDGLILDAFRASELQGELCPNISISEADKKAAVLNKLLKEPVSPVYPFIECMHQWWTDGQQASADICTVCGVRPQGWGAPSNYYKAKAKERNICYVCLNRRSERAKQWAQGRYPEKSDEERNQWERTIWIDEVADDNGRLALLVGCFDLSAWLGGDMIQTMLVACDASNNTYESKNPSFARIQRVWRTTQQFWLDVQDTDIPSVFDNMQQYRLAINVQNSDELYEKLGYYHVYDAELDGRRLSVVWDSEKRQLVTADNLVAWAGSRNITAAFPSQRLKQQAIPLYEPGGYRQQRKLLGSATIRDIDIIKTAYTPAIAILNEPSSFMTLVPAAVALDIATRVRERYDREMSKVRNRLPFFMGLVFFDRRQPLFSALDAGRRMLNLPLEKAIEGRVVSNVSHTTPPDDLQHDHFKCWQEITVEASHGNEQYVWRASTVMGDGRTSDDWYPYVYVISDQQGNPPVGRKQFPHPVHNAQQWVHVADVQPGDTIQLSPACFSWLFLDTATRRFEAGEKNILPLEELKRITALWDNLQALAQAGKLTESTWHALIALLKIKHDEWGKDDPETYEHLAEAVLANDGLHIVKDATPTRLMHTFELYSQILKQKLKEDETR